MTDDIVERLRKGIEIKDIGKDVVSMFIHPEVCDVAADEIIRLRAENEKLREEVMNRLREENDNPREEVMSDYNEGWEEGLAAMKAENERIKAAFRVNMLRAFPNMSHEEIDAEIAAAIRESGDE